MASYSLLMRTQTPCVFRSNIGNQENFRQLRPLHDRRLRHPCVYTFTDDGLEPIRIDGMPPLKNHPLSCLVCVAAQTWIPRAKLFITWLLHAFGEYFLNEVQWFGKYRASSTRARLLAFHQGHLSWQNFAFVSRCKILVMTRKKVKPHCSLKWSRR